MPWVLSVHLSKTDEDKRYALHHGRGMSDRGKRFPIRKFLASIPPMVSKGRTSKKRAAPSLIGPKAKKVHLEKPHKKDEKSAAVKRSKPVTLLTNGSDIDSDGGEGSSEEEDVDLMNEDDETTDAPTKDPNGVSDLTLRGGGQD